MYTFQVCYNILQLDYKMVSTAAASFLLTRARKHAKLTLACNSSSPVRICGGQFFKSLMKKQQSLVEKVADVTSLFSSAQHEEAKRERSVTLS